MKVQVTKCDECGILLEAEYLTFAGNVYRDEEGGLIGNNLDNDDKVIRRNHFCFPCTAKILGLVASNTRVSIY